MVHSENQRHNTNPVMSQNSMAHEKKDKKPKTETLAYAFALRAVSRPVEAPSATP